MSIQSMHPVTKEVSTIALFKGEEGITTNIHLSKGAEFMKHHSKTRALLICIIGEVVFENQNGSKEILKQGDYVNIEPFVGHWINSITDNSYLLLIK